MATKSRSAHRNTYTITREPQPTARVNEHLVRVMRDGEPVNSVVVVSTSSSSAYFREGAAERAKTKG